jgi:hypothetical protein
LRPCIKATVLARRTLRNFSKVARPVMNMTISSRRQPCWTRLMRKPPCSTL